MKRSLLLLIASLNLLVFGGFYVWLRSPGYAVRELESALKTKDLALLYSRIDLPSIYDSAIDALATQRLSTSQEPPGFLDKLNSKIKAESEKLTQGQSIDLIKHEFELEFRRNRDVLAPINPGLDRHSLRLFANDIKHIDLEDWVKNEDAILLNTDVALLKMKSTYRLILRLEKSETGAWRVVGFEGLASILSRYENDRKLKVEEHNKALQTTLSEKLPFFGETRFESSNLALGLSSTLYLDILFENKFDEAVKRVEGQIRDHSYPPIFDEVFQNETVDIPPGAKKVFLINKPQYLKTGDKKASDMTLIFQYSLVELASGKIYRSVKDFDEISN